MSQDARVRAGFSANDPEGTPVTVVRVAGLVLVAFTSCFVIVAAAASPSWPLVVWALLLAGLSAVAWRNGPTADLAIYIGLIICAFVQLNRSSNLFIVPLAVFALMTLERVAGRKRA